MRNKIKKEEWICQMRSLTQTETARRAHDEHCGKNERVSVRESRLIGYLCERLVHFMSHMHHQMYDSLRVKLVSLSLIHTALRCIGVRVISLTRLK